MLTRRSFLKNTLSTTLLMTAIGAHLIPRSVFASLAAFDKINQTIADVVQNAPKGSFTFKTPKIAENGAVVPLTVDATSLPNVSQIAIFIKENATQLSSVFDFKPDTLGFVSTRVKMLKSSSVSALVTSNGKTSVVTKDIRVTVGGCGG